MDSIDEWYHWYARHSGDVCPNCERLAGELEECRRRLVDLTVSAGELLNAIRDTGALRQRFAGATTTDDTWTLGEKYRLLREQVDTVGRYGVNKFLEEATDGD